MTTVEDVTGATEDAESHVSQAIGSISSTTDETTSPPVTAESSHATLNGVIETTPSSTTPTRNTDITTNSASILSLSSATPTRTEDPSLTETTNEDVRNTRQSSDASTSTSLEDPTTSIFSTMFNYITSAVGLTSDGTEESSGLATEKSTVTYSDSGGTVSVTGNDITTTSFGVNEGNQSASGKLVKIVLYGHTYICKVCRACMFETYIRFGLVYLDLFIF